MLHANSAAAPMTEAEDLKAWRHDVLELRRATRTNLIREVLKLRSETARAKADESYSIRYSQAFWKELVQADIQLYLILDEPYCQSKHNTENFRQRHGKALRQLFDLLMLRKSQPPAAGAELPTNAGIVDR